MSDTYIFENVEVKSTGRFARRANDVDGKLILCEVTPVNADDGTWVKKDLSCLRGENHGIHAVDETSLTTS